MGLVKMRKANRVINIDSSQAKSYLARGYDQIGEDGEVKKQATGGKTISPADYNRVLEENETLRTEIAAKNGSDINTEKYDLLEKENKELHAKYTELQEEMKTYEEENQRLSGELKEAKRSNKK